MNWQDIKTAPKDGTAILLTQVEDDGVFGIRHGFWEKSPPTDAGWYDIDGEKVWDPAYWCPVEPPPGGKV